MRTVSVRISEETAASVKRVAAAKGKTPGVVLATAWRWYLGEHGEKIAADLEAMAESLRRGQA